MELSATELIDAAKQIEESGEAFYGAALDHLRDPHVREVFAWLLAEEARHAESFEAILGALTRADWRADEQYLGYLRALIVGHVFPSPDKARELATKLTDDRDAIELATEFERDTIRYFEALRTSIREADRPMVDRLIEEEWKHVEALEALRARRTSAEESAG